MLLKLAFAGFVMLSAVLTWPHLVQHVVWKGYREMVAEIRQGRFVAADRDHLAPVLAQDPGRDCTVLRDDTLLVLHFYATELEARRAGVNAFEPADDLDLTRQREALYETATRAVACAPMNGELWLNLAVIARALGKDAAQVERYLAMSRRYAPHEGLVSARRDQLF